MTDRDLAEIIAEAQKQGAPEWGVTVIVRLEQLAEKFADHVCEHEKRRAPWREIGWSVIGALVLAIVWWALANAPSILGVKP